MITDPFLRRAYELAESARGRTHPNPLVGCVIVADDRIVGEGYHARAGADHAEIVALRDAGSAARGAHVCVTLEPCAHHGRTPPCVDALLDAGVARVTIGVSDPNPDVAGDGARVLRDAGVDVVFSEQPDLSASQNEDWVVSLSHGRPWVTVKTALSLDGHPSRAPSTRTHITGEQARSVTMQLRRRASVVLVGAATVLADEPSLLLLSPDGDPADRQPDAAVLCRSEVPDCGTLAAAERETLALVPSGTEEGLDDRAVTPVSYDEAGGLASALVALHERGHTHVLIEAGPALLTSAWDGGLIDELVLYHAGGMLGAEAPDAYAGAGDAEGSTLRARMGVCEAGIAGSDAVTVWRPLTSETHR